MGTIGDQNSQQTVEISTEVQTHDSESQKTKTKISDAESVGLELEVPSQKKKKQEKETVVHPLRHNNSILVDLLLAKQLYMLWYHDDNLHRNQGTKNPLVCS